MATARTTGTGGLVDGSPLRLHGAYIGKGPFVVVQCKAGHLLGCQEETPQSAIFATHMHTRTTRQTQLVVFS